MKHILNRVIKSVKSVNGSSLAEFATTTALMATLAATAAPKLSEMAEGSKQEKTMNEIDKIIQQGQQFYQDTADLEGRGRFPGQGRFDMVVGGKGEHGKRSTSSAGAGASGYDTWDDLADEQDAIIEADLFGTANSAGDGYTSNTAKFTHYEYAGADQWLSVFGLASEASRPDDHDLQSDDLADIESGSVEDTNGESQCSNCQGTAKSGHEEWLDAFGGETLNSPYQDGHYIYRVVPGYGTGNSATPPILYVADLENPANFNAVLMP